jgi:hypothetical protein
VVQWSAPGIQRPSLSAWLVRANQQLFINLGPYAYITPAGCVDETVSSQLIVMRRDNTSRFRFIIIMTRLLLVER